MLQRVLTFSTFPKIQAYCTLSSLPTFDFCYQLKVGGQHLTAPPGFWGRHKWLVG
jgi:hypothetical protein